MIEQGDVDVAVRDERLEVDFQIDARGERVRHAVEQHGEVDVAARMQLTGHRRAELQQQANSVRPGQCGDGLGSH